MNDRGNVIMSETRGKHGDAFTPIKFQPDFLYAAFFSFRFFHLKFFFPLIIDLKNAIVIGKQRVAD